MSPSLLHAILYWILPLSVALGAFFIFLKFTHKSFEKTDVDRIWKVAIRVGIGLGAIALIWVAFTTIPVLKDLIFYIKLYLGKLLKFDFVNNIKLTTLNWWQKTVLFILSWLPIYLRAVILIWVPSILIWLQGLIWRINFNRALNIIGRTILLFPYLCFKYLLGYQTPFFDYVQSKLYIAKIKENLNDSYFDALQGIGEDGKPFNDGQGGTVRTQAIKAAALAVRQTHSKIKTANGVRHAQLTVRHSRETSTDQVIEQALKGLGLRLSAPSIRFQEDPLLNPERGGYIFDSDVKYSASDSLGSWRDIFSNPFSEDKRISNGGDGALKSIGYMYRGMLDYFVHLTPTAIYERFRDTAQKRYTPDISTSKAKYKAQQNLDLSVVPAPKDEDILREEAIKVANERVSEVTDALTRYKLNVSFDGVEVGGNTAVYTYTLSRSSNIPTDWSRIQEGLANLLRTKDIPIVRTTKGQLLVTMVNGVNIPIDFSEMITKRPKGIPGIISGIAGEDAMGNIIDFNLGDEIPHAMLFGKTGTGKTVLIMNIIYSMMSAMDPDHLQMVFVDGKGNSFEFMRTDDLNNPAFHPNPYVYAQPADGSGDIEYARALVQHMVRECRRRIALFKSKGVSKLEEFNKKFPDEALPEILMVIDEFSALTDSDALLKASELAEKGMTDAFEYLAKMARSTGIRMLLANQTARKEKVPGRISANVAGRISLGVSEPIESDIALPDSGVDVHLISQPGEFYSAMHGARNIEHGNTPYLPDDVMFKLNASLEKKFGHRDYAFTRQQILCDMEEGADLASVPKPPVSTYPVPSPMPTPQTPIVELVSIIEKYPEWANKTSSGPLFKSNEDLHTGTPTDVKSKEKQLQDALDLAFQKTLAIKAERAADTRKNAGNQVAPPVTSGDNKGIL